MDEYERPQPASPLPPSRWDEEPIILAEVVPEPPPDFARRPPAPRRRWTVPLALFLLTCLSTFWVGGLVYSVSLMTILVCHELGHFFQARRYGVPATLPLFIPLPLPPIGTLGAVIAMSSRIRDRRALFDIGITGPLLGLVPTMVCIMLGLSWSHVGKIVPAPPLSELGEPLLFKILAWVQFGPIPEGYTVYLHPVGVAGWVGLLITSLNLFPIGQLDGGHVLYALLRHKAHTVAWLVLAASAVAVVILGYYWWFLMLFLVMLMGPEHAPTGNDHVRLGPVRVVLGWLTLAFLPIGFTPNPFAQDAPSLLPQLLQLLGLQ
ncbi:MAG TPA: site-2 protease family protein [Planctomycetes bacterium]|nr:site-2 protease family protein [Planctomycetota bacterium]